jgi:hypothetical protein
MQQPQQTPPVQYYPYFNQVRAQPQVHQVQQPLIQQQPQQQAPAVNIPLESQQPVHGEQQQQSFSQIYPPTFQPQQPMWSGVNGGCRWSSCCRKFEPKKTIKGLSITIVLAYIIGFFITAFHWHSYSYYNYTNAGSYLMPITMAVIAAVIGIIGAHKSNIVLLGAFIGMTVFSLFAGTSTFFPAFFRMFATFGAFVLAFFELIALAAKIASIVVSVKLIKKIKSSEPESELPQFAEVAPAAEMPVQLPVIQPVQPVQPPAPQFIPAVAQPIQPQQSIQSVQPVVQPVIQQQEQQQPAAASKSFDNELVLLREMGFTNTEFNIKLLQKHNGNLAAVLQVLINA